MAFPFEEVQFLYHFFINSFAFTCLHVCKMLNCVKIKKKYRFHLEDTEITLIFAM